MTVRCLLKETSGLSVRCQHVRSGSIAVRNHRDPQVDACGLSLARELRTLIQLTQSVRPDGFVAGVLHPHPPSWRAHANAPTMQNEGFPGFEASSLSDRSYPIEVAWVFQDGRSEDHLIAPRWPGTTGTMSLKPFMGSAVRCSRLRGSPTRKSRTVRWKP